MAKSKTNHIQLPAVALRGMTILPEMVIHFDLSRAISIVAVEQAMTAEEKVFLVTQNNPEENTPSFADVYHVGTIACVKQVTKLPGNIVRVLVEGISRGRLLGFVQEQEYLLAEIEEIIEIEELDKIQESAMMRQLEEITTDYIAQYPRTSKSILQYFNGMISLQKLIDQITLNISLTYEKKQEILEAESVSERFEILTKALHGEIEISRLKKDLADRIRGNVEKNQKEYLLREQLQFIQKELGVDGDSEEAQYEEELRKLKAGKEVKEKIAKEINRLKTSSLHTSESAISRTYIETLLELPWDKFSRDNTDLTKAEEILNADHYGMDQVKSRILEFLAVRSLTKQGDSPIICLVGPPGTGKTSIARAVADALNKKYVRISLGGIRDEAEIRGHRKTYIGAMPGRIAAGLKQAGVKNPLMLLDEIDKVSSDYKGDTASALLEVLDSEQNNKFRDHYIELPLDLSEVLFIATANSTSTISKPLLDRMEIIEVTSYIANEKFHIAKKHLLPKQLKKNGLDEGRLVIGDSALHEIIQSYTRESGVRELERKIGEICRKAAREILQKNKKTIRVTAQNIGKYLGKPKFLRDKANEIDEVGIVRGLAWTSVGGDTLQIEVNIMPGKGEIELTGQLGDVMKESARTGISYIRSVSQEYGIAADFFKKHDFHLHIPEGAVPKDGPSAGISMATAMLSAITGIPVKASVAMTGEITLRGRVLPIGGLKEKTIAAKTAGITTVIVPKENEKDIEEIAREIKAGLTIVYAEMMKDVLAAALVSLPSKTVQKD